VEVEIKSNQNQNKSNQTSNQSIANLQSHLEKGTCLKTLRYNIRANITPDEDFNKGIGLIRKKSEQALVGALVRYHHRCTELLNNQAS